MAPSDSTPPSLQASQQRLMDQWRRQQWRRRVDQVGRCTGQPAPRHASCAGQGKSPASLCGCVCPAPHSPQPRGGGGGDREVPRRPSHPGLLLQESATVRGPQAPGRTELPLTKRNDLSLWLWPVPSPSPAFGHFGHCRPWLWQVQKVPFLGSRT